MVSNILLHYYALHYYSILLFNRHLLLSTTRPSEKKNAIAVLRHTLRSSNATTPIHMQFNVAYVHCVYAMQIS
jgi:hypothetical protein